MNTNRRPSPKRQIVRPFFCLIQSREPGDDRGEPAQSRGQTEGSLEMKIDRDGAYELDRIPSTIRAGVGAPPVSLPREGRTLHRPFSGVCAALRPPSCRIHDAEALVG